MIDVFLSILRKADTPCAQFRQASDRVAQLLAAESGAYLARVPETIQTPLDSCMGQRLKQEPILIVILRSGIALLPAFMQLYPSSAVGFIGIQRDEITATPHPYFEHLPQLHAHTPIFILDPMVATGQTATLTAKKLIAAGAVEKNITLFSLLAAPEGRDFLHHNYPHIQLKVAHLDDHLDPKKWIVPGLGDFGDRYFGV
jgi:uracil phosphoribosyltransferase